MTTFYADNLTILRSQPPTNTFALNGTPGFNLFWRDKFAVPSGTATTDLILFAELPVDKFVKNVRISTTGLGTNAAVNVGLYYESSKGVFTALDATAFASAQAVASGTQPTEITYEAGTANITEAMSTLWEKAGLTERPSYGTMFLGVAPTVQTSTLGTLVLDVELFN